MKQKVFRQRLDDLQHALADSMDNLLHSHDTETLHELRVALRRLRTILRPLARKKSFASLYTQVSAVLNASNPVRDLQVLMIDLSIHRHAHAATLRREHLQQELQALITSPPLLKLSAGCHHDAPLVPEEKIPNQRALQERYRETIVRAQQKLLQRLEEPEDNFHKLRLDIKQLRYLLEENEPTETALPKALAAAQTTLGDWHDREIWLIRAETESDLHPCVARWQRERVALEKKIPGLLERLHHMLGMNP